MSEPNQSWSFRFITISVLIGALISSWVGPKLWVWFYEPPVELGVSCAPAVTWAMSRLLQTQAIGAGLGLLLGLVLVAWSSRRRRLRQNSSV